MVDVVSGWKVGRKYANTPRTSVSGGVSFIPAHVRALIDWAIDDILGKRELARVLVEQVPRLAGRGATCSSPS